MDIPAAAVAPHRFDLTNPRIAYRWASNGDLRRIAVIFTLMSWRWGMHWGSKLLIAALRLGLPILGLLRATLFRQFFAGETRAECQAIAERLRRFGVGAIFDYAVEGGGDEASFRACYEEVLASIPLAAQQQPGFVVFKVTGLCRPALLAKISAGSSLTAAEERSLAQLRTRIDHIAQEAHARRVSVLVDAEESWLQNAIDTLSCEVAEKYNHHYPVIYITLQMYRHDRLRLLQNLTNRAEAHGYYLGIKLVRGAYLSQENQRARKEGRPSPLYASKEATDQAYDQAIRWCVAHPRCALMLASHNLASTLLLTELLAAEKDQPSAATTPVFAQLLGMSDYLTYNLAKYGFKAYKYIPYGPLREAVPYLLRRAEENTAIGSQLPMERDILQRELRQRGLFPLFARGKP